MGLSLMPRRCKAGGRGRHTAARWQRPVLPPRTAALPCDCFAVLAQVAATFNTRPGKSAAFIAAVCRRVNKQTRSRSTHLQQDLHQGEARRLGCHTGHLQDDADQHKVQLWRGVQ